ncbi:MAG: hypothetical protein ACP5OX_00515 [Minisyncoccia bacterium]
MDWGQFTNQASQFFIDVLKELDLIINKIFVEGIISHFIVLLKSIGKILVAILEIIIKLLKPLVK